MSDRMTSVARGAAGAERRDRRAQDDIATQRQVDAVARDGTVPRSNLEDIADRAQSAGGVASLPFVGYKTDPRDERMRDIAQLASAGKIGPDKFLGQRYFDPQDLDYIDSKRVEQQDASLLNLLQNAYDPEDPYQATLLARMIPQYQDSRRAALSRVQEQQHFIGKMGTTVGGIDSLADMKRLVYILGGSEKLLTHPLYAYQNPGGGGDLMSKLGDTLGIFSYFSDQGTSGQPNSEVAYRRASLAARISLAGSMMHLFPAFLTGRLEAGVSGGARTRSRGNSARALVGKCEDATLPNADLSRFIETGLGRRIFA
jgi:hypothetical protein